MAVHVPLSIEAQVEARVLMMSVNNILSPANGKPIVVPTQDMVLGIYFLTKARGRIYADPNEVKDAFDSGKLAKQDMVMVRAGGLLVEAACEEVLSATKKKSPIKGIRRIFSDPEEVRIAYDSEKLEVHEWINVRINGRMRETTCGRIIFGEILPEGISFDFINKEITKKELTRIIEYTYKKAGKRATVVFLDNIEKLGFELATKSGISICMADMHIPSKKPELIKAAEQEVMEIQKQYADGLITHGERYNKVIDIWANVTERIADEMMKELGAEEGRKFSEEELKERRAFNNIFMMADSGARGSTAQIRQLAGMRGLMAKPSGEIIETPITANFREGLTPLQYFISTHGARKGLADTALKTANSGYLTRRLVDVAQDVIITEEDCGTTEGITVTSLIEGGEIIEPLEERIIGRFPAEDILEPDTKDKVVIVRRNTEINAELASKVVDAGIDRVKIRSVLTCQTKFGVCGRCYGRDLARGESVEIGEAVGIIAAQSIGEPGTQLTMRTFHIGGAATKVIEQAILDAKNPGKVKFLNINAVRNREGALVVINRNALIAIVDGHGREREKYNLVYGAKLKVEEGQKVEAGQRLVEWDPYSTPILTEVGGKIALGDIVEGVSVKEEVDEITGLSHKVIIDYPATMRPRISIKDEHGKTYKIPGSHNPARYLLPAGAHILVEKGDLLSPGDILAKIPRETTKTKDITGGLPRVAELFEARRPKEQAIVTEIDGVVEFRGAHKGMRVVVVKGGEDLREYHIPKGKHVSVHEGDWVKAGEPLMDGAVNPHSILDILGPNELQSYLVDEVQKVYRLQGVSINDKHIETIVRQMMRKVRVEEPGDTTFLIGEQVDRAIFQEENERVKGENGVPAQGRPLLLGITKASLTTESWVSAASFQETTRVLTEAALNAQVDELRGL
ncbi:MAG TPA: DNA-directed RNA polymerase subunit beta', partial [Thermodesulfovibrionales bacterium]|nr:DNA-directed RNA polymerase subunit beta' [Thermodesulfovibrionales bacterium]